jgi:hypothetical protein
MLPSGQKLTLDLLDTVALEVVPFRASAPFPAVLPFFKCNLKVMICEGVLNTTFDSAMIASTVSK